LLFKYKRDKIINGISEKSSDEDKFSNLLFWKSKFAEINKIKAEDLKKHKITNDELQKRREYIEKRLSKAESLMINLKKGLYFGTGYSLNDKENPQPIPIYAKWKNLNNHIGFKGTTRVGKTVNMLSHIEQCIANDWDVIVIDPKGGVNQEVISSMAENCFQFNKTDSLSYYSPAFPDLSEKINVLYGMSNIQITSTIMDSIKTPTMEDFYIQVGNRLIMSITISFEFLQEVTDPDGSITRMLEEEEIIKYNESRGNNVTHNKNKDLVDSFNEKINGEDTYQFKEYKDIGFNRTLITYRDLEYFCHFQSLTYLKDTVESMPINQNLDKNKLIRLEQLREEALSALKSALGTKEEHFAKVADSLSNRLLQLSIGPMGELLCTTRINPILNRLLDKSKSSVTIIQPFPMMFKDSSIMFNKMVLGMFDSFLGTVGATGRAFPRRISIFIDEAGSIAYPGIENFLNRGGGLGATMFLYTQSNSDYKDAVGDTLADIILDNVNTVATMRQNLKKSAEEASEDIGNIRTHKTQATIQAGGEQGSYSTSLELEALCTPEDIKRLPMGEGILRHDGKNYYMEFPFRTGPKGAVLMPELKTEASKKHLANFEKEILKINNKINQNSLDFKEAMDNGEITEKDFSNAN